MASDDRLRRVGGCLGFALPAGIWWFYFRLLDRGELRRRVGGGQVLTYLHLPMTLAVVVMAAAVEVSLSALGLFIFAGGLTLVLAALGSLLKELRQRRADRGSRAS